MMLNYFKTSLRSLIKFRQFTIVNLAGLSISAAVLILIAILIQTELSWDRFHANADTIYRVMSSRRSDDGTVSNFSSVQLPLGPALKDEFPQVERFTRIQSTFGAFVGTEAGFFPENVQSVDPDFFRMFSFKWLEGDSASVFSLPHFAVLSEKSAHRYFGTTDPIGKEIDITIEGIKQRFTVNGVVEDTPKNSTIRYGVLIPIETNPTFAEHSDAWNRSSCKTYVQISKKKDVYALEMASDWFLQRKRQPDTPFYPIQFTNFLTLESIKDMHLNTDSRLASDGTARLDRLYILVGIALLILLVSCMNYATITSGLTRSRTMELGARRAMGASRSQVAFQILTESVLLGVASVVLGCALAEATLPQFNDMFSQDLSLAPLLNPIAVAILMLSGIMIGLFAGIIPAIATTRVNPIELTKKSSSRSRHGRLTRLAVMIQFASAVFLILSTSVMDGQIKFMQNTDLGFDQDFLVVIPTNTGLGDEGDRMVELFRTETANEPGVVGVTGADYSFVRGYNAIGWPSNGVDRQVTELRVAEHYLSTIGAHIIDGRDFNPDNPSDERHSVIVNETLVKEFELENPVGSRLDGWGTQAMGDSLDPVIIGVVKDFHTSSMKQPIKPTVIDMNPHESIFNALVRISPENSSETLQALETEWRKLFPDKPFDLGFVEDDFENEYRADRQWESTVRTSSILAAFIACLGLFGLSTQRVVGRTKEIGIRKVHGASITDILTLVSKEFLLLVLASNLIAWPLAYFVMRDWLTGFIYRTSISTETFVVAALISFAAAMAAIATQAIRAATSNPVNTIRYE